jgi:hypothetical protein
MIYEIERVRKPNDRERRKRVRTNVDVELLVTAEREKKLDEEVDAALSRGCVVRRSNEPSVASLFESGVSGEGGKDQCCFTQGRRNGKTHLMVEATPPRRIVEGCSVKEMILDRGGSTVASGVARRKARPAGSCERNTVSITKNEKRGEKSAHQCNVGENGGEEVVVGVRVVLLPLTLQEHLQQQVQRRNLLLSSLH